MSVSGVHAAHVLWVDEARMIVFWTEGTASVLDKPIYVKVYCDVELMPIKE